LDDNANHQLSIRTVLESGVACQWQRWPLPCEVFNGVPGFGRELDKLATRLSHELSVTDNRLHRRLDEDEGLPTILEQLFVLR
jgi:hypothetical protein